jgi:hypothetical protein
LVGHFSKWWLRDGLRVLYLTAFTSMPAAICGALIFKKFRWYALFAIFILQFVFSILVTMYAPGLLLDP